MDNIADFICVYDLNERSIKNVPFEKMIRNEDMASAAEWAEFLECYTEVIDALIRESSVFINSLSRIAYNSYSSCFSSTAVSLYRTMKEKAKETKLKRGTWGKATPKGTPSPNKGKFIVLNDKDSLLQDLKNGLSNQEIMKKYDCGYTTLFLRCKTYFNATPDEVRGIKAKKEREKQEKEIAWKQHLEELTEQRKQRWTGEKNPNYIDIDYELLDELLIQDKTLKEIAPIMGCAHNTLISKIKKRYNMTTREYREYVKSKNSN